MFTARFGQVGVAFNHLDSADDEDFARVAGLEKHIAFTERNFGLIDFDDAFEKFAIRIDHRAPQFLRQQPSGSVGEAELILQLPRRQPLECVAIKCAAQNHAVSGSRVRCIAVPAVIEV